MLCLYRCLWETYYEGEEAWFFPVAGHTDCQCCLACESLCFTTEKPLWCSQYLSSFSFCKKQSYKNLIARFYPKFSWHFSHSHMFNLFLFSPFLIYFRDCILGTSYSLFSQLWWLLVQEVLIWASLLLFRSIYYYYFFVYLSHFLSEQLFTDGNKLYLQIWLLWRKHLPSWTLLTHFWFWTTPVLVLWFSLSLSLSLSLSG